MAHENYQKVTEGFRVLQDSLHGFVQKGLKDFYKKDWWGQGVLGHLHPDQLNQMAKDKAPGAALTIEDLDVAALLAIIDNNWHDVFKNRMARDVRNWVIELKGTRNKWAHAKKDDLAIDDAWRALDTMARLLEHLPDRKAMYEVRKLASSVRQAEVDAMVAKTQSS